MEQIIFDSSYLLRTAIFLKDLSLAFDFFNEMRNFHRDIFSEYLVVCGSYFLLKVLLGNNTLSNQLLRHNKYFFSRSTVSEEVFLQNK